MKKNTKKIYTTATVYRIVYFKLGALAGLGIGFVFEHIALGIIAGALAGFLTGLMIDSQAKQLD